MIRSMIPADIEAINREFVRQGWPKRTETLQTYFAEQQAGTRHVFIATDSNVVFGYVTLVPLASHGPFTNQLPEITDFNVFAAYRRRGIGRDLLGAAEAKAAELAPAVSLGVGLHPGYGSAQRLYVKRGFIPDGSGVWYLNRQLQQGEPCANDDDLVLYMSKQLDLLP